MSIGRGTHATRPLQFVAACAVVLTVLAFAPPALQAQGPGIENGEWHYLGGDAWHTRYTTADEITAENFEDMELLWQWDASSFGPSTPRATPSFTGDKLITVTGERRHVIALSPYNGELLWSFTEPNTHRYEFSMRKGYGKGVAYADVPGRGEVAYITTPGFFLWALDADTGEPLEDWGEPIPIEGFRQTGGVDLVKDLIEGWGPWEEYVAEGGTYDPYQGIPQDLGFITSSSPPIVVNETVVVGNSAEQGYLQTRVENVPGDILAYDAQTGDFKWKFHVIPRPGEVGHDTWESDAWQYTGDVSSWAPMSADPELGLVYIVTNGVTVDYYGGFHPGDNLFSTSIIALDADTGERAWHYQMVHHDIWNYDTPVPPLLMDVTVDGEEVPGMFQATKQGFIYALNRETGEPIWPIEERPVEQSTVPGEQLSPTQPWPTTPPPFEMQGRSEEDLIDYTPELREMALQKARENNLLFPLFDPPTVLDDPQGPGWFCPGDGGGTNTTGNEAADPTTGLMFVTTVNNCSRHSLVPGEESPLDGPTQTGDMHSDWSDARGMLGPPPDQTVEGLDMWKGPDASIVAYDMNSGEIVWRRPTGEAPREEQERIRNHPMLQGVDDVMVNRGRDMAAQVATPNMLIHTGRDQDNQPMLFALDKRTGEEIGRVEIPGPSRYGISSWVYEGHQYVLVQLNDGLAAFGMPAAAPSMEGGH